MISTNEGVVEYGASHQKAQNVIAMNVGSLQTYKADLSNGGVILERKYMGSKTWSVALQRLEGRNVSFFL